MSEDPEVEKYKNLSVFNDGYEDEIEGEVFTNVIGEVNLTQNEKKVLANSPKLAILGKLDQEVVKRELEVTGMKSRWDYRSNPGEYTRDDDVKISLEAQEVENETRRISNFEEKTVDFSSTRATDSKLNSHVHLPKPVPLKFETELQIEIAKNTKED